MDQFLKFLRKYNILLVTVAGVIAISATVTNWICSSGNGVTVKPSGTAQTLVDNSASPKVSPVLFTDDISPEVKDLKFRDDEVKIPRVMNLLNNNKVKEAFYLSYYINDSLSRQQHFMAIYNYCVLNNHREEADSIINYLEPESVRDSVRKMR